MSKMRVAHVSIGVLALLTVVAVLLLPGVKPWVLRIEHWTADWRTALLADHPARSHERISVVVIDDTTLKDVVKSPIDRRLLARIVRAVDATKPRAIGLDLLFFQKTDPAHDAELIDAIKTASAKVVLGAADERTPLQPFQREFQADYLARTGRPIGFLNLHHDPDNVVRYAAKPAPGGAHPKSFASQLAEAAGYIADDSGRPISWLDIATNGSPAFLSVPAHDLLADPDLGSRLKDHIVLIGGDFPLRDRHRVPLTLLTDQLIPGVEVHAQILAGMIEPQRAFSELGVQQSRVLLLALAGLGFALGWRIAGSALARYASWGASTAVIAAVDAACYRELRLVLPFTLAAVAWFAGIMAGRFLRTGLRPQLSAARRQHKGDVLNEDT